MPSSLPRPHFNLAPAYVYGMLAAILPLCASIDLFVSPTIYWPNIMPWVAMSVFYVCFIIFLTKRFGPYEQASAVVKTMFVVAELMLLFTLTSNALPFLDQMTKISAFPLVDHWLAAADDVIGFDWLAYWEFVHDRPYLINIFDHAYAVTGQMGFLVVVILLVTRNFERVQYKMEATVWIVVLSLLISVVTPAVAAGAFYEVQFSQYPNFGNILPGQYHLESLLALRDASPDYAVAEEPFKGLTTFPSVHTSLGLILVGATWRHWLFWPCLAYALVMIPSTPIFGSHYLIDIIGGAALTFAVMFILGRKASYRAFLAKPAVSTSIPTAQAS